MIKIKNPFNGNTGTPYQLMAKATRNRYGVPVFLIAVALFAEDQASDEKDLLYLAIRWLPPQPYTGKDGKMVKTTNELGGETDWFVLPTSFGYSVAKGLISQKVAGRDDFDEAGSQRMIS